MYKLFKGYVPTKDKKCLIKFKNARSEDLQTYRQISNLPEYAGILNDETILIDIDDFDQSEILMEIIDDLQLGCRVYETTRGKHFLFKNRNLESCKTHTKLACGITADIKLGCRNSYSILKYKDTERKIIYDINEDEDYDVVPKWLMPINSKINFLDMEAGDGRNQSLFNYILTLQSNDFTIEESRQCLGIINDYVLSDPLSETELETLSRDEAFQKPVFFNGKTFLFDKFAMYLKNSKHIKRLNGRLHIYKDGIYVDAHEEIESAMIENIPNLNRSRRAEVLSYLDILVRENSKLASAEYIAFKNGIYNVITKELTPFDPEIIITNKINYNYNPSAECEIVDNTFRKLACGDEDIVKLLEEAVGYTFYKRNELRKSFMLTGDKKNGKSTFLAMLKELLGDDNTSALDLKDLGDRFSSSSLFNKLANIGDDIGDEFINNPAMFKKIVSGDRIRGEFKGQKEFFFEPYCKLFFSANNIPRIKDKSGAVIDRLIIIPFNATFSKDDPDYDPYIKYKLIRTEALEYLIKVGIKGLERVLENQCFTTSEKAQKELEEYEVNNNPVLLFFGEIDVETLLNNPTNSAYRKYNEFCIANSFQPMSQIEFSKQIKKRYDFDIKTKSIQGKKYRVFVRR
jgi:putative DNA primase/helicase